MTELAKARIDAVDGSASVEFQFNPTKINFTKTAEFRQEPTQAAQDQPSTQFVGTGPTELALETILDDVESAASRVPTQVQQLLTWTQPEDTSVANPRPPLLTFTWGQLKIGDRRDFRGHLKQVGVNFELFRPDGTPVRAKISLKLAAESQEPAGTNPTSASPVPYRSHTLSRGDTLHEVAYRIYGDPTRWRDIASYNDIDDPLRIRPGTELLLPMASELEVV